MFIKSIRTSLVALTAALAMSAQAGIVGIQGTIVNCVGLCAALSGTGNYVNASFDTDFVVAPELVIEGNAGGELTFIAQQYMNNETSMNIGVTIPTPAALGVDLSSNSDQVSVFGLGSTTSAPVWGIFDLQNQTFESYLFTTDAGGGVPGIIPLA
ncbi:MAG: hypothetical protein VX231_03935, partial [Pseudomonadota bacterium]|nr:hypothetical protein [Pseudomonadota bacterium]